MLHDLHWIAAHIGCTPLLDITPPEFPSKVIAKAEYCNLTGSVKDRAAFWMLREGLKSGELSASKRILEATSGNTGIALAVLGRLLGYQTTLVMSPQASRDRKEILRSAGAEVIFSNASEGSNGALLKALSLYNKDPDTWFWPNQYYNPANYLAHRATADEIFADTKGTVTHFVSATGTGGTAVGVSKRLHELKPAVQVISVEPAEELHGIEGTKHMATESVPVITVRDTKLTGIFQANRSLIDRTVFVKTEDAYDGINRLAALGLFAGLSSGANYIAACRLAEEAPGSVVVTVLPDSSDRYLSEAPWDAAYFGIAMPHTVSQAIWRHFEKTYPHEGCGLLFGRLDSHGKRQILVFEPLENLNRERAVDRYEINPKEMMGLERKHRADGLRVRGIVHSHPDHPPVPSAFDLEAAWEDLSYIICSVVNGCIVSMKSWALVDPAEEKRFREELIRITGA